jgi:outer membrane protein OmpA-like peptidoglycan-associated protein
MTRKLTIATAAFAATSIFALSAQADQAAVITETDAEVVYQGVEHTTSADPSVTDQDIIDNRPLQSGVPHQWSGSNIDGPNAPHPVFIDEQQYKLAATQEQTVVVPEQEPLGAEVEFPFDKAYLTDEAKARLDSFARELRDVGSNEVLIEGHTDRSGPADYNMQLSQERAATVANYLKQHGIVSQIGEVEWEGETEPEVMTGDGVRLQENRRVEMERM